MPELIPIEKARQIVLDNVDPLSTEDVPLLEALGRILATDAVSDIDINPFDDSSMDGFAVRSKDLEQASSDNPCSLQIVGLLAAGDTFARSIEAGQAARIMTGAAIPDGADAVIKIEAVTCTGKGGIGDQVIIAAPVEQGTSIRKAGEEAQKGAVVMKAGEHIDAAGIGLLACTKNMIVPVYKRPRVAILSIGSELVDPWNVPGPGMKRNSNGSALAAACTQAGGIPVFYPIVPDSLDALRDAFAQAQEDCDLIVSSGGACGGDFDFITQIIAELGDVLFEYVDMRPGKAQTFGLMNAIPVFGLSGNPAAASTGFEMLVRPAIRKMQGYTQFKRPVTQAILAKNIHKKEARCYLLRGRVDKKGDSYIATPDKSQSSALMSSTHRSNCFIILPQGDVPGIAGMQVDCIRIDMEEGTVE